MSTTWIRTDKALAACMDEAENRGVEAVWSQGKVVLTLPVGVSIPPGGEARVDRVLAAVNRELAEAGLLRDGDGVVARHVAYLNHEGAIAREVVERAVAACRHAQQLGAAHLRAPSA